MFFQNMIALQDRGPDIGESEQVEIGVESIVLPPDFLCSAERLKPIPANT